MQFDLFRTMHGDVKRFLKTRHMQDVFDYFIKYVGSSAYHAPAFMNCLPTIQFRYDLWYVDGGLYNIALGLQCLLDELRISVCLDSEVTEICKEGNCVTGVMARGHFHPADLIVSNMEVIPAYERLLHEDRGFLRGLRRFEPACSGLAGVLTGIMRSGPRSQPAPPERAGTMLA
ncbi:MAG: hypothetical protein NTU53_16500 [Planctomycetota bacterium]|nr:hypothetical protein [Planctomycetota bacterium]